MPTRPVRDLMLPLSEYAVVDREATLAEALEALEACQDRVPPGRQPHRAVLVRDQRGQIIGKLGHLSFLRALLPEHSRDEAELLERAGVCDALQERSRDMMELFSDGIVDLPARARHQRVGAVCSPVTASVDVDAMLITALRKFLDRQTLSLLVTQGRATVGILRLADVFDALAAEVRGVG